MIADGWTVAASAFVGAVAAHVVEGAAVRIWQRYRRRSIIEMWHEGADRALAAHPLAPEDIPPAEPRAIDLDKLSKEQQRAFFERIGAPEAFR